jgi:hypothetical protein
MKGNKLKRIIVPVLMLMVCSGLMGQTVPGGVHYQAVARDNSGYEIANKDISVRFSILTDNPDGPVVYQEIHTNVRTSPFGVFSLVIGGGTYSGGTKSTFSEIQWETSNHYVKVEVKFSNDYLDMGTMQFFAVPYALYAKKSLEPGPQGPQGAQGPKGEQGDPATDNQKLSFDGSNLSISPNGNTVNLSILNKPHSLTLLGDSLTILGGNGVSLKEYRQNLNFNLINNELSINGGNSVNLNSLKNDADADPVNEIQTLTYNPENFQLSLSKGGGTVTLGQIVAFRAGIGSPVTLPDNSPVDLVFDQIAGSFYCEGGGYNNLAGTFMAPNTGIYIFSVSLNLPPTASVIIKLSGTIFETIIGPTSTGGSFKESITMRLNKNDVVNVAVKQTNGYPIPSFSFSGYFSGYRIY